MNKAITKIDFPTETIKEGQAQVLVPKLSAFVEKPGEYAPSKAPVFYNPIMELNRDVAILALQAYQRTLKREISVCEPLAGCGVRGIRFAREVEGVKKVVINDINKKAYRLAKYNVELNGLSGRVTVKNMDANLLLAWHAAPHKRFDAVDVDPFGSPTPFMDSAIRAARDGGLLALTATDMAPLCGVHPKACMRKYGGKPLRTEYCHEIALRLVVGCAVTTAAKHEIGLTPLFSHSTDHYVRVYVALKHGAKEADDSLKKLGYILHCFSCFHRETMNKNALLGRDGKCPNCGSKMDYAGPLWLGKIADENFCTLMEKEAEKRLFKSKKRTQKILALVKAEASAPPTYYVLDKICSKTRLPVPPVRVVVETLRKEGFEALLTHFNPKGVKTDASISEMLALLKRMSESE
ncbi:MAG: tRNA (guanine(10)-N(2))-dimethyltransferase [Candidatus Bathyarchaeota archaeon]|nr:tRNA (guanine(10)-N(2))-dimethyltransferase [Candidatus Bathyarchaeota archaeon]MDW8040943.1 tRNA (guanine(10)-N(2))-dimethyltransferase [Nitrososphaerota archaeon]